MKRAVVITSSDKGYRGEREDLSGPRAAEILERAGYRVVSLEILPDDRALLAHRMAEIADQNLAELVVTTGGTGFSERDVTPEATEDIIQRRVPGIPEAMRAYSMTITKRAMLSRASAGIRERTLIVNLPGSPKAVTESLEYIIDALEHGIEILTGEAGNCAAPELALNGALAQKDAACETDRTGASGRILAVCTSPEKGTGKQNVEAREFVKDWGIRGDAHAGKWHRQVSLLSYEKIEAFRKRGADVEYGDFGENLVVEGIDFAVMPVGTIFLCSDVVLELTQIGKECHQGCAIFRKMGDCIMPREGVFARVLQGGIIRVGDKMTVKLPEKSEEK